MKNKFLKGIFTAILICNSLSIIGQNPNYPEGDDDDPTSVNIDSTLSLLVIGAIGLGGFVFFQKHKKEQAVN